MEFAIEKLHTLILAGGLCASILALAEIGEAAEIEVFPTGKGIDLVALRGEILSIDGDKFSDVVAKSNAGAVLLESPGGDLLAGLQIGRLINELGLSTGVAPETACASACALAWLAGSTRFMHPSALVGFHAAYVLDGDEVKESGVANALVGAYLNELGLGSSAVVFATSASPQGMSWLNAAQARRVGINLVLLEPNGTATEIDDSASLRLPSGFRWIVLESALTSGGLKLAHLANQTVETSSGYYASVIGPFETDVAEQLVATLPFIPADAYLSSGNGFLFSLK